MKLKYLPYIDVLRAISIIIVVLFHLDIELFKGGFIGVDIFFVISGFLITRLIVNEVKQTSKFNYRKFYLRRIKRLIPSLFLTLSLVFIGSFLIFSPSDFIKAAKSIFASSVAVSNFYFLGESGYFDVTSHLKPLLHTWSLAIEEQFYLIFPVLLVLLVKKFKVKTMLIIFVLLFFLSFVLTYYACVNGINDNILSIFSFKEENEIETASAQFFLLPFRMFEFFIGTIFALIPKKKINNTFFSSSIHFVGILGVFLCSIFFSADNTFLPVLNVIPCLIIGLLLYLEPPKPLNLLYKNKGLIFIGKISYTFYLIHWPVIVFYRYIIDRPFSVLEAIILFVISFVISAIIYTYYENPIRHSKKIVTLNTNYVLPYSILGFIALFFMLKNNINSNNGWLFRISDDSKKLYTELNAPKAFHTKYYAGKKYKFGGMIGNKSKRKADYIFIGDSHVTQLLPGFETIISENNSKIKYTRFGGLPFTGIDQKTKFEKSPSENMLKKELALNPKATILISVRWNLRMLNSSIIENNQKTELKIDSISTVKIAQKINELQEQLETKIIVLGNVPERNPKSVPVFEKIMRPDYLSWFFNTESTYEIDDNSVLINSVLKNQLKKEILFIDPSQAFCNDNKCLSLKGKLIFQSDLDHLTKTGSQRLVNYFKEEILSFHNK